MELETSGQLLKKLNEVATGDIQKVSKKYNIPAEVLEKARNMPLSEMINPHYPYRTKMRRKAYSKRKEILQIELVKLQKWIKESGQKVVSIS